LDGRILMSPCGFIHSEEYCLPLRPWRMPPGRAVRLQPARRGAWIRPRLV